ncbi:lariat debranching enzyme [Cyclospora cayetanensis]|uniref:Lariat debranching enzyme n=1 Tax=Cyclospora cayetanensis TaxID=88456 RepID=A0A6P6S1I8_9EIME|nr:lariat debranching enzyme [Cyclospora cayetanensis]
MTSHAHIRKARVHYGTVGPVNTTAELKSGVNRDSLMRVKEEWMVAVNGCCHGELNALYGMIEKLERQQDIKVDLLICCGDFQSLRSSDDLQFFCAPPKYRTLKDFHEYFSGSKRAPVLTVVVGGNHEAPNVFRELYYGGWLAPNIFYLGHSGVVKVGGLRIAGLSGIYNPHHFHLGHFEKPPYDGNSARSAYHVRQFELLKLNCVQEPVDIMLSHDWPEGIYNFGDREGLLRCKPHFREDIEKSCLGSPPSMALLKSMKPSFWFCGHLHVSFPAIVPHPDGSKTLFLAADKVLPNRRCLQVLDVHPKSTAKYLKRPLPQTNISTHLTIEYDLEWLCILRANQKNIPTSRFRCKSQAEHFAATRQMHSEAKARSVEDPRDIRGGEDEHADGAEQKMSDGEEVGPFPWPHWSDPPFQELEAQRKRLLQIIGHADRDVFTSRETQPHALEKKLPNLNFNS